MADTFKKWIANDQITTQRDWTKVAAVVVSAAPPIAERIAAIWMWGQDVSQQATFLPRISNLIVLVLIAIFVAVKDPLVDEKIYAEESSAVKRFRILWICFWLFFCLVYLFRTVGMWVFPGAETPTGLSQSDLWVNAIDNGFSNLTLLMLFLCYVMLAGYRLMGYVVGGILFLIFLTVTEAVGIHLTSKFNSEVQMWIILLWQILLGTLGCTVLALLVGRLESKIIDPPLWIIFALYFYAALQPVSQVFGAAGPMALFYHLDLIHVFLAQTQAWLVFVSALLKVLLFALVYWLLDSGVLLYYFNWLNKSETEGMDKNRSDFVYEVRARKPS